MNNRSDTEVKLDELKKSIFRKIDRMFLVGCWYFSNGTGAVQITETTSNSIRVFMKKVSDAGIDCHQWFEDSIFFKRFQKF